MLFLSLGKINNIDENSLYKDLLRKFKEKGHNLYIISPIERKYMEPTNYTFKDGVHFLNVKIGNITETSLIEKGIATFLIAYTFKSMIKKHFSQVKFDLILYATPPITFESVVKYVKNRDGAKSYLLLKDIFPQNAIDMGILRKKTPLYIYFKLKEKKLYTVSDFIGCMSAENVRYLLESNPNLNKNKVEISPNTIEPRKLTYFKNRNSMLEKYNIPSNKIKLLYGGNLGVPQGIDYIISCIKSNRENNKVHFVIVGSGTEYFKLEEYLNSEKPKNLTLIKKLPKTDYEKLLSACDVGLIFLDCRFTIPNFPSRVLSYMEAGKPVLAATDKTTDIGKVITENNFGRWCVSKSTEDFNNLLPQFYNKAYREIMGENARNYLEKYFTTNNSYRTIIKHFN